MARLRAEGLHVKLRAVGDFETAEYKTKNPRAIAQLEIGNLVEWAGFTQDVSAELARMDLFVLPSLFGEGLPMVILEAMAAGVPIVGKRAS